ncbi:MAG: hypothetical protein JWR78_4012 [Mycobacterium sp.]|jgi:hypothetical protein|nr:hypothetical protein [Mycobacterium sp.]
MGNRDVPSWYAALGETLWWIVGLDDQYRRIDRERYESHRDEDIHGCVLPGLRFARNRVGHGLAVLLSDPTGRSVWESVEGAGVDLDQLIWRPSEMLSCPGDAKNYQRQCYDQRLANKAARYAIRHANYFFVRRKGVLDGVLGL